MYVPTGTDTTDSSVGYLIMSEDLHSSSLVPMLAYCTVRDNLHAKCNNKLMHSACSYIIS